MRLNIRLWRHAGEGLFWVTVILLAVGSINILSASFVLAGKEWSDSYYYLMRHLKVMVLGFVLLFFSARWDYRRYKPGVFILAVITLVTLAMVPVFGLEANGAKRWLKLGIIFQPSELAKLSIVMLSASYLGRLLELKRQVNLLTMPFLLAVIMGGLVFLQPDMGTAMVIIGMCVIVYIIAGLPKRQIIPLMLFGLLGGAVSVYMAPYRYVRVAAWLNPWAYQQDIGYQAVQSLLAIGSGELWGTGFGRGASKFFYLPESHTDFAFAVLSQEWGFVGVAVLLLLFIAFAWYGLQIALHASETYGILLAGGLTFLIVAQAIGNMAMVCGLLPVTGVPLPFISFGGTSLLVNMTAVGILISVARHRKRTLKLRGGRVTVPERESAPPQLIFHRSSQRADR